jgi:hypothetical protein
MSVTWARPVMANGGVIQPSDIDDLAQLADALLAKVQEVFGQVGIALPGRQYVTLGTPAQDCEQVTVAWQNAYAGLPGQEMNDAQRCDAPRSAVFIITITRCVPVADGAGSTRPPKASDLTISAHELYHDAWLLLISAQSMDDYLGIIANVEAGDAQGGLQSVALSVTLGVP